MRAKHVSRLVAGALALAVSLGLGSTAWATAIDPGFDLFSTGPGAFVDLSAVGLPPNVGLKGVPLGGGLGLGNTDTIVERKQGIDPFDPPGGLGTVDIELVALHLTSVAPVDLTPLNMPGVFADLHVTINQNGVIPGLPQPDQLLPSIGQMEIRHTVAGGGDFDSCFGMMTDPLGVCAALGVPGGGIYGDAIFTLVGGDPANLADVMFSQPASRVVLSGAGALWSHTPPPSYPESSLFPAGMFYPGVDPITGAVVGVEHVGPHPQTIPSTPEPASLSLLLLGGMVILRRHRG